MWGGGVPPLGWLECNGQSTAGSAALIAIYGTNVPDLRGEFVRGWDHGKGVDQGRNVRSFQGQDIQPHTHTYVQTTQGTDTTSGGDTHYINASSGITGSTGGTETRPRNVALMFIVKT
jgi:microcystin-dependent protein